MIFTDMCTKKYFDTTTGKWYRQATLDEFDPPLIFYIVKNYYDYTAYDTLATPSKRFDPGLVCELCGKTVADKRAINKYGVPGFIHYCGECKKKILKGEKMKQDIWVTHADNVKAAREKKAAYEAELRKKKIARTKCDNCGKLGAKRVWFLPSSTMYDGVMAGFDKNLCDACEAKLNKWYEENWAHSD